jgi:methyl-accepting chemotaxis protein
MRLTIKLKLLLAFGFVIFLSAYAAYMGVESLSGMKGSVNQLVDVSSTKVKLAARISQNILEINRAEKNLILSKTTADMDQFAAYIESEEAILKSRLSQLRGLVSESGKAKIEQFDEAWAKYSAVSMEVRSLSRLNSNIEAADLSSGDSRHAFELAQQDLAQLMLRIGGEDDASTLLIDSQRPTQLASEIRLKLVEIFSAEKSLILANTQGEMNKISNEIEVVMSGLQNHLVELNTLVDNETKTLVKRFQDSYDSFVTTHLEVEKLTLDNGNKRAIELSASEGRKQVDIAQALMADVVVLADSEMDDDKNITSEAYDSSRNFLILLTVFAGIIGMGTAFWIATSISKALGKAVIWLKQLLVVILQKQWITPTKMKLVSLLQA